MQFTYEPLMKKMGQVARIAYFILAIITINPYLYSSPIRKPVVLLTLLLGAVVVVLRLGSWKSYLRMPGICLFTLFLASFLLSTVANATYGVTDNLKWTVWMGIQIYVLYLCDLQQSSQEYLQEFRMFANAIISYSLIAACISFWMMVRGYEAGWVTSGGEVMYAGILVERLWGCYRDPNYGATFAIVAILLSWMFLKEGKMRILFVASTFINVFYLIFSGSRTGYLALYASFGCYFFFELIGKDSFVGQPKEYIKAACKTICLIVLSAVLIQGLEVGAGFLLQRVYDANSSIIVDSETGEEILVPGSDNQVEIGREDIGEDVSNGRFAIWESGLGLWKTSPILGTGCTSVTEYARQHQPDGYIARKNYLSMHNSFLNTLVYQGLLGMVIFCVVGIRLFAKVLPVMFELKERENTPYVAMLSCVVAMMVAMLFLTEGLYTLYPGSFILWCFMGYLVHFSYRRQKGIE